MDKKRATYGSGTIYKQGNSLVSQLLYTITIDGEPYSKRITGSGKTETAAVRNRNKNAKKWEEGLRASLEQAEENHKQKREQQRAEEVNAAKELTLNTVFIANLAIKDASIQAPTSDNYLTYYQGYVENNVLGNTPICEITEEMLMEFYKNTRLNGRKRTVKKQDGTSVQPKPLSISTINHIRFVVNNTFQYAIAKGIINQNPHLNIVPFKAGTAAMLDFDQEDLDADSDDADALERVIPLEEVDKILIYAFEHSRLAGLYAWALNTGMREGECLGLKRRYAEPQNNYIYVKKSLTYIKDRNNNKKGTVPRLKKPKNGKERKVPFNKTLEDIYYYQLQVIEREKSEAGEKYHDRGLLFADEYGNYLRPWKVLKEFQQILEAVGIRKHRFHDLRHTFVSLLVRESQKAGEGISILEVSAIVGHSDPTVTMRIYGGLFPNAMEKAMKILEVSGAIRLPIGHAGQTRGEQELAG